MAIRIQLRRDTAANWTSSNPVLRAGELGIETDTLKFKIGNGSSTWTQITNYANVTSTGLSNSLNDYILSATKGTPGGPAELDSNGDLLVPENSVILWNDVDYDYTTTVTATQPTADRTITIPNATGTMALTSDLSSYAPLSGATFTGNINVPTAITFEGATADSYETTVQVTDPTADRTITFPDAGGTVALTTNIPSTTDNLSEGSTNKYYTDERAQDAIATAIAAGTHTNITITYDDDNNKFTFVGANTYSDENAQDAVGNALGTGLSYNDTTGAISVDTTAIQARVADVSDTEIGYLNGVTSAIQTQIDAKAPTNSPTFTGTVTLPGAPTSDLHAATKAYVDASTSGLNVHASVKAATTENVNLNNGVEAGDVLDGVTLAHQDRILVKNQNTASENGVYVVQPNGAPERAADYNTAGEVDAGDFIFVESGTANSKTGWIQTNTVAIIGSDAIAFTQFSGAGTYTANNGLTLTGNVFSINTGITADLTTAQTLTNKTLTSPVINTPTGITKSDVGLANVDNTTDANKPVSTATQTALDLKLATATAATTYETITNVALKAPINSPTFTGTVSGITSTMVGLGNVDNTSDANKPVSTATQTALDLKVDESLFDAKGDLLVGSADNTPTKLSVGTNGYLLTANSSAANGVEWAAAPVSLPSQSGNSGKYLTTDGSTASWGTLVVPITTGTATVTANTATTVDTVALSGFTSIEYMVSLKQGSKVRTSKVVVQTDGTSVDMTEFAITETGGQMTGVVVSATTSSTNAVLQVTVTDATSTNVNVKFSKVVL